MLLYLELLPMAFVLGDQGRSDFSTCWERSSTSLDLTESVLLHAMLKQHLGAGAEAEEGGKPVGDCRQYSRLN